MPITAVATVYQSAIDRVHAFVQAGGGGILANLYDNYWDGSQWIWEDHGTPPTSEVVGAPVAVYQSSIDRVHVFVVGDANDNFQLHDNYWNGSQWIWEAHGTPTGTTIGTYFAPAAVYQSSTDRVHAFVVGLDGNLYDNYWDGSQWIWANLGTPGTNINPNISPAAVYRSSSDQIQVFVVGLDGNLYDIYGNGSQWTWEEQGLPSGTGTTINSLAAVYESPFEIVHAFTMCADGNLYDNWNPTPVQRQWAGLGAPTGINLSRSLSAVYQSPIDRVHAFVVGLDGNLYDFISNAYFQSTAWDAQGAPSGISLSPSVSAVYQSAIDRVHAFVVYEYGDLYDNFTVSQWNWEDQGTPV